MYRFEYNFGVDVLYSTSALFELIDLTCTGPMIVNERQHVH